MLLVMNSIQHDFPLWLIILYGSAVLINLAMVIINWKYIPWWKKLLIVISGPIHWIIWTVRMIYAANNLFG